MKGGRTPNPAWFLILAGLFSAIQGQTRPVKANVSLVYFNAFNQSSTNNRCECGMFGVHSLVAEARGLVVLSNSSKLQACMWDTHFAPAVSPWIALVARGNCTFTEKIQRAAKLGAVAVVIYNYAKYGNNTVHMSHPGKCYRWTWAPFNSSLGRKVCEDSCLLRMDFDLWILTFGRISARSFWVEQFVRGGGRRREAV